MVKNNFFALVSITVIEVIEAAVVKSGLVNK